MIFLLTLCGLVLTALIVFKQAQKTTLNPNHAQFEKLQKNYLTVFYLAIFSDWLQGPYVYQLYSDYGYEEEEIAILYITGFASSSICGAIIGHVADRYGRKMLCILFGLVYSICCVTKLSSQFSLLLLGRIFGGISTSILFSTFEAWYVNEHINHLDLPPAWLNITFSKAGFWTGFLAIIAGIISQISAETLNLGSASPFILAIPFLLLSSFLICVTWQEHFNPDESVDRDFTTPLYLILFKDPLLLFLGLIQSLFEAVMYTFIFSWTPMITELDPPLGIVFACFMLAFMIGSKTYRLLLSYELTPQFILILTSSLSFVSFATIAGIITYISYGSVSLHSRIFLIQICFLCFNVYEVTLGLYCPAMGYLRSRIMPEKYRASITNWFRVPMNIFTCISLTLNRVNSPNVEESSLYLSVFKKFQLVYFLCTFFLFVSTGVSLVFRKKYSRRFSVENGCNTPKDTLEDIML